jgi:hypothetical protein
VQATAAWSIENIPYIGSVVSDQDFASVTPVMLEGSDFVDHSVSGQILYSMQMSSGGRDGFDFKPAPGAGACLSVSAPSDVQLLVGARSVPAELPLDLDTLAHCQSPPQIAVDDVLVDESAAMASFTLTLSAASTSEVQISYATTDGSATAPADYAATSGVLVLTPGELGGRIDVPIVDDNLSEGSEYFTLDLTTAVNAVVGDAQGLGTITDNEASACGEPTIDYATEAGLFLWRDCASDAWHLRASAGGGPMITYEGLVSAEQAFPSAAVAYKLEDNDVLDSSDPATIQFQLMLSGTGKDGFDFQTPATGQTCFNATAPSGVQVHVGSSKDVVGAAVDLATLGDCTSLPGITVAGVTVSEGDGIASFTVSLSAASSDEVRVDYATSDGTATDPDDYGAVSATLILAPGELSGQVDVPIVDDGLAEGSETFSLTLSNASGAIVTADTATATIADNEAYACGEPSIDAATETGVFLWQDCPSSAWHMRVTAGGGPKITYEGQVVAEQAFPSAPAAYSQEGADWMDSSDPRGILFSLNVSGTGQDGIDFETPVTGQACFDLTTPANAQVYVGADKDLVGTSLDLANLGICVSTLRIDDVTVNEGAGTATFTVSLSLPSEGVVTVDYATLDGSATAGADYTGIATTQLVFGASEIAQQIVVAITDDSDFGEGEETFSVELSNAVGASILAGSGQGTIQDND